MSVYSLPPSCCLLRAGLGYCLFLGLLSVQRGARGAPRKPETASNSAGSVAEQAGPKLIAEKLENELHFCFRELLLVENLEKQLKNTCFWLVFSNEFRSETLGFLACRWNTIKIASL